MRRLIVFGFLAFLGSACGEAGPVANPEQAAVVSEVSGASPLPASVEVNFLTRNLYVRGDISPIIGTEDPVAAANEVWNEILRTDYPAPAAFLAAEIARIQPDLVGLQEVIRFTVAPVSEPGFPADPLLDFLEVLQLNLAALGADDDVAIRHANTRFAAPVVVRMSGSPTALAHQ